MNLTYKDAGVDIAAGARLIERIRGCAAATARPEVIGGLGGFAAVTALPAGYREPVLVSATDGVGTKLRLALALSRHDTIGIDLVAMCVNDLLVQGAEPLLFLDYFATARLDVERAATVIAGIAAGCAQAGCALVGGETAEMPGMYQDDDYDLAGFAVGVAERAAVLDGTRVRSGDVLLALGSSGPHSNGYALIRQILTRTATDLSCARLPSGQLLGEALLQPTRIYARSLLPLLRCGKVHAMAHITGGGFWDNIPRVLPPGLCAFCELGSWSPPEVFAWIREQGGISRHEMLHTFNCGVGMVIMVAPEDADASLEQLRGSGEQAWVLGHVAPGPDRCQVVIS